MNYKNIKELKINKTKFRYFTK